MEAKKKRERFSKEIRSNVVKLVIDGGKKSSEVAAEHGIPVANVYAWVRQARVDAGDLESSKGTTSDRAEVARLKKALRERENELSFLKKTLVYFAVQKKKDLQR